MRDKVSDKCDQATSFFSSYDDTELYLWDEEFSDALEEVQENTLKNAANDLNEVEDTETQEEKPKSYIKRFQDLDGLVKRVFSRYAEIENDRLKKSGLFFWADLYQNGIPVPDQYDNLKQVLSPGQTVKFNCFEIVDDAGNYFLKVTVAWKGSKPKITEIMPEKFIDENYINFSGNEISTSEDLVESNCSESMKPLNAGSAPTAAPRNFLTVGCISDDDDSDEEKYQPHPSEDLQVITLKEDSNLNTQEYEDLRENVLSSSENMDIPQLTDAITRMLEILKNSQLDSKVVASDLVNMILNTVGSGKIQSSQANAISSFESTETNQRPEMVDSYAPTIFTGV